MAEVTSIDTDSVVVLFKGGRLPAWHALSSEVQDAYARKHVDLMLSVARRHRLMRLEGFRLMAPQRRWERFWVIEFPTMAGAEAWIDAEIEPPYGTYGYHDYFVSRSIRRNDMSSWVTRPPADPGQADQGEPPALEVDRNSVVVLLFGRWLPEADIVTLEERGDHEHVALMQSVARDHGLMRMEAFQLIGVQNDWHRAWVIEFPTIEGAEAWIETEVLLPHGRFSNKEFHLARKWAPRYFARWVQ